MQEHDIIVIGAGHNGLIVAAYLAKAGLDVCVAELQDMVGGCVMTKELTLPGFKHDLAGTMHMTIQANPLIHQDELGLKAKYGLEYVFPDPVLAIVFPDDRALVIYRDINKTCESIQQFSAKDADTYLKFCETSRQTQKVAGIGMFSAPPSFGAMMSFLDSSEGGREFMRTLFSSAQDIAEEWFESKEMRSAFGRWTSEEMIGPRENGTGFYVAGWPLFHTWGLAMPVGGSGALSEALAACIRDNGGTIRLSCPVKRVKVQEGKVKGIVLENGEEIGARRAIVSNVNIKQLFLSMLEPGDIPAGFQEKVRRLRHSTFALLLQHLALNESPKYKAGGDVNKAAWVEISPYRDELLRLYDDYSYGAYNTGMPILGCATLFDPSRAPEGKHTLYLAHFEPYSLQQKGAGGWDKVKQEVADGVLEIARRHTTNLGEENILGRWIASPLDMERINPSVMSGDIGHIGSFLTQSFGNRPLPGWSQYRTPVERLYMTGASTHPGCGITGGGRATVRAVMEDLGIDFKKVIAR